MSNIHAVGGHPKKRDLWNPVDCPWLTGGPVQRGIMGLDEEIRLFYDYLKPTSKGQLMRQGVVDRISLALRGRWPDIKVVVFGSVANDLCFPWSDIDIALVYRWDRVPFEAVRDVLVGSELVSDVRCFEHAIVPIIRTFDRATQLQVDISFRTDPNWADPTKLYMRRYPDLKYIVYVVKYLLSYFGLNEVYTGGLSSYAVCLLVANFFKTGWSGRANLGVVLIEFLHLFGCVFNYQKCGISLRYGYFLKKSHTLRLCLVDPNDERNDITRGSFNVVTVFELFENSFHFLNEAVGPAHAGHSGTILGQLFKMKDKHLSFMEWIDHL